MEKNMETALLSGQLMATSPDLTLNGGLCREYYQSGLKLGIELILNFPVSFGVIEGPL